MGSGASVWFCFSSDSTASESAIVGPLSVDPSASAPSSPHNRTEPITPIEEVAGPRPVPVPIHVADRSALALESSEVTPRRERALQSGVPATPTGELINVYRYYCPLCMFYYEDIMRSSCCGNYCCYTCTVDYLDKKGLKVDSLSNIVSSPTASAIPCPLCNTNGFEPKLVELSENVRDYSTKMSEGSATALPYSPIRIGDDFDVLKRKMQPYPGLPSVTLKYDDGDDEEILLKDEAARHRAAELLNDENHQMTVTSGVVPETEERESNGDMSSYHMLVGCDMDTAAGAGPSIQSTSDALQTKQNEGHGLNNTEEDIRAGRRDDISLGPGAEDNLRSLPPM